jgi:hypothetical protein
MFVTEREGGGECSPFKDSCSYNVEFKKKIISRPWEEECHLRKKQLPLHDKGLHNLLEENSCSLPVLTVMVEVTSHILIAWALKTAILSNYFNSTCDKRTVVLKRAIFSHSSISFM